MSFEMDDSYVDVAERIREFRDKYADGSLQQHRLDMITFNDRCWVVYTAAAYRSPDDQRPGMGTAWEPVPGRTPFTRDSEVQNAETAAWGRAIVAVLAADTKKVASRQEVQARQPDDREQAWNRLLSISRKIEPDLDDEARRMYLVGEAKANDLDGRNTGDLIKLANLLEQVSRS